MIEKGPFLTAAQSSPDSEISSATSLRGIPANPRRGKMTTTKPIAYT
jgi:hypothetical protein